VDVESGDRGGVVGDANEAVQDRRTEVSAKKVDAGGELVRWKRIGTIECHGDREACQ